MNVSLTNVDSVNAILQVNIVKDDYQERFDKALKGFRKKANMPGFRPGTVPMGMVNKMYGKSIMAEEVNKLVGEAIYNYIQENKINILGEPLPNIEKQQPVDFSNHADYEFFFDIALSPAINLTLSKSDSLDFYKITVDDELIEKQIQSYKASYGKYEKIEEGAKDTDLLKGIITEQENSAPKQGGIVVEAGVVMPSYMKDKEEQAKFIGAKPGDIITFNPAKAYDGAEAEIASLLHVQKDQLCAIAPEFTFQVTDVTRYKEAELDQELFDRVLGAGTVKTVEEFKEKMHESIAKQLLPDSDYKFLLDAKKYLEEKVGDLQFPDAFLKRWLLTAGKERTPESVDEEYPKIIEDLKFHLIKEQIVKDFQLKLDPQDVKAVAIQAARAQFAQYGMMHVADEMAENYANEMLKKEESSRGLVDRAMEVKIIETLKANMTINEKEVSVEDFRKFFEDEENAEA